MGFTFQLVSPKIVQRLGKTHRFAGMSLYFNGKGEKFYLGKTDRVGWHVSSIQPQDLFSVMRRVFGEPNQLAIDDGKMTFNYIFKSKVHKNVYYEIYDYRGSLSCGVGVSIDIIDRLDRPLASSINNGLQELIDELITVYNLMVPE